MTKYCESTLRKRAKRIGFTVEKGYQRDLQNGWGTVKDLYGKKITGYDLYDSRGFLTDGPYPSSLPYNHRMTLDEIEYCLKMLYEDCGLPW